MGVGTRLSAICLLGLSVGCSSVANRNTPPTAKLPPGTVTATKNPQVALYTITPPAAASVTVNFGTTQNYGQKTWSVSTPSGGGAVKMLVAGMLPDTTYHMRAFVQYQNGTTADDTDHIFTTSHYRADLLPRITAVTAQGQTPQPGVEMLNPLVKAGRTPIVVTNLAGQVIWAYTPEVPIGGAQWGAPKQLENGDYIAYAGESPSFFLHAPAPPGATNLVREFDLAGNTIKQITMAQLNAEMSAANFNIRLISFSHDVTVLPNGHWLVITTTSRMITMPGSTAPTKVLGDVIVDLDTNLKPVWVWNEFDHLDINRHPENFPDWTHTNAVLYSKDDGNIIVSLRHQNWLVKVDYNNGAGSGNIIWRLGYQGDFKLIGGVDPTDWFSGQHDPSFTSPNTTGIFRLTLMDNGDFRTFAPGSPCAVANPKPPSCLYTAIPIFQINEAAKTATLVFRQVLPTNLYSFFGGNSERLPNGDIEYDLCGLSGKHHAEIFEVTNQLNPQTVWTLKDGTEYVYRGYRLPSLYPGVQW